MPASDGSCSCTSCLYRSGSESPSVRRLIAEGTRIDRLYLGKYIPLRERKLLNKLIKTRAIYDDAQTDWTSSNDDTAAVKRKRQAKENDRTERSSALPGLVGKGLSDCCSCCSCASLAGGATHQGNTRTRHSQARRSKLVSKSTVLRGRKKNRGSHLRGTKNTSSTPCMCPERCPELFSRPTKSRHGAHLRKSRRSGARKSTEKGATSIQSKSSVRTESTAKENKQVMKDTQVNIALKRCFCTLKLKPKKAKRKLDSSKRTLQSKAKTTNQRGSQTEISPSKKLSDCECKTTDKAHTVHKTTDNKAPSLSAVSKSSATDTRKRVNKSLFSDTLKRKGQSHQKNPESSHSQTQSHPSKRDKAVYDKDQRIRQKPSQSSVSVGRSKYTMTKHSLKRCFCTLKLQRSGNPKVKEKEARPLMAQGSKITSTRSTSTENKRKASAKQRKQKAGTKAKRQDKDAHTDKRSIKSESSYVSNQIAVHKPATKTTKAQVSGRTHETEIPAPNKENIFINKPPKQVKQEQDNKVKTSMKEHGSQGDYSRLQKPSLTQVDKKNKNATKSTALKRCLCTLKYFKRSKLRNKVMSTTGTETPKFKEARDEEIMTKDMGDEDFRKKSLHQLKPYECEPNICVPGECDPYECFEIIKQRDSRPGSMAVPPAKTLHVQDMKEHAMSAERTRRKSDFGTTTERPRTKSSSGVNCECTTSSSGTVSKTIKVKDKPSVTRSQKPKHKHLSRETAKSSRLSHEKKPRELRQPTPSAEDSSSRQVVRISSSFSFDIKFYRDRPLSEEQTPEAKSSKHRKVGERKKYHNRGSSVEDTITTSSQGSQHTNAKKARKSLNPILKRCFCTLSLQKQIEYSKRRQPKVKKSHQVFAVSRMLVSRTKCFTENYINNLDGERRTQNIISNSTREKIKNELINNLTADSLFKNISPSKDKFNVESLMRILDGVQVPKRMQKSLYSASSQQTLSSHSFSFDVKYNTYEGNTIHSKSQLTDINTYLRRCVCTFNMQVPRKLEPYECEPGVCVPDECDPIECQKLIQKRLAKKSPKMTGSDTTSTTSATNTNKRKKGRAKKLQSSNQVKSTKSAETTKPEKTARAAKAKKSAVTTKTHAKEPSGGIVYQSEPNNSRKQVVRVGSSFSFDIEFSKRRSNEPGYNSEPPSQTQDSKSKATTKSRPVATAKKNKHTRGSTGGRVNKGVKSRGNVNKDTKTRSNLDKNVQSQATLVDKGSSVHPKLKRCFCTLKLQKKERGSNVDMTPNKETMTSEKQKKKKIKPDLTSQATMTRPDKRKKADITECVCQRSAQTLPATAATAVRGQNTKKYKGRTLDPHECEPNICIPGECDPYECLERIKERNKEYKEKKTETSSSTTTKTRKAANKQTKARKTQIRSSAVSAVTQKKRLKKGTTQSRASKAVPKKEPLRKPVQSEGGFRGNQQVVRIGSSFSFSIEFYKNRAPNSHDIEVAARAVRSERRAAKTKKVDKRNQGTAGDVLSVVSHGDLTSKPQKTAKSTTQSTLTKQQASGPGALTKCLCKSQKTAKSSTQSTLTKQQASGPSALKRCFCTLKLQKQGKNPAQQKKIKVSKGTKSRKEIAQPSAIERGISHVSQPSISPTSHERGTGHGAKPNTSPTSHEKGSQKRKLAPYECEPGICTPGTCDPYECEKLIKQRLLREVGTTAKVNDDKRPKKRTVSSMSSNKKGQSVQGGRKRNVRQGQVQSKRFDTNDIGGTAKETSQYKASRHSSRQAVTIGSSFSFDIEFYKDRGIRKNAPIQQVQVRNKPTESNISIVTTKSKAQKPKPLKKKNKPTASNISTVTTKSKAQKPKPLKKKGKGTEASNLKGNRSTVTQHGGPRKKDARSTTADILKRCFCTLALKNKQKGRNNQVVLPMFVTRTKPMKAKPCYEFYKHDSAIYNPSQYDSRDCLKRLNTSSRYNFGASMLGLGHQKPYTSSSESMSSGSENLAMPSTVTGMAPFMRSSFYALRAQTDKNKMPRTRKKPAANTDNSETEVLHLRKPRGYKLAPGECEPGICIPAPGQCDPYECLERMKKRGSGRGRRSVMMGTEQRKGGRSIATTPRETRGKQGCTQATCPRGTDVGQYIVEEPRFKNMSNPFRQAVRISSSFTFNIEFYKDQSPCVPEPKVEEIIKAEPRRKDCGSQGICQTDKAICQQGICLRNRGLQASSPNRETRATGDSRLKRCFCTLKLQGIQLKNAEVNADRQGPITIDAMDRGVTTKNKYLEPYECPPGVCIPGECDPYECLKRFKKKRHAGTYMPCPYKCAETGTSGKKDSGTGARNEAVMSRPRRRERVVGPNFPQTSGTGQGPTDRQAVRFGSSFKFDVEFFKDQSPGSPSHSNRRPNVKQREPIYRDTGTYQPSRKSAAAQGCTDQTCRNRRSQMTGAQTESRGAGGNILRRCFCTLKLQKPYAQTKTVQFMSVSNNFNRFPKNERVPEYRNMDNCLPSVLTDKYNYRKKHSKELTQTYPYQTTLNNTGDSAKDKRYHYRQRKMHQQIIQVNQKFPDTKPLTNEQKDPKCMYHYDPLLPKFPLTKTKKRTGKVFKNNTTDVHRNNSKKQSSKILKEHNKITEVMNSFKNFIASKLKLTSIAKSTPPPIRNAFEKVNKSKAPLKSLPIVTRIPKTQPVKKNDSLHLNIQLPTRVRPNTCRKEKSTKDRQFDEMKTIYPYIPKNFNKRVSKSLITQFNKKSKSSSSPANLPCDKPEKLRAKKTVRNAVLSKNKIGLDIKKRNKTPHSYTEKKYNKADAKVGLWKRIKSIFNKSSKPVHEDRITTITDYNAGRPNVNKQKKKFKRVDTSQSERHPNNLKLISMPKKSMSAKMYKGDIPQKNPRQNKKSDKLYCRFQSGDADYHMLRHKGYDNNGHLSPNRLNEFKSQNRKQQHSLPRGVSPFLDYKIVQFAMVTPKNKKCTCGNDPCRCLGKTNITNKDQTKNVKDKSKKTEVKGDAQKTEDIRICKTTKPCACCIKNKSKDGSTCIKTCETKLAEKAIDKSIYGKPLFDLKMDSGSMCILNRDQIYESISKLKPDKELPSELLARLHGKSCKCCFCKSAKKNTTKQQDPFENLSTSSDMPNLSSLSNLCNLSNLSNLCNLSNLSNLCNLSLTGIKKMWAKKPCTCGSLKCQKELKKEATEKQSQKNKKKQKRCQCGSKVCGDEALNMAIKKKLISKEKSQDLRKELTAKKEEQEKEKIRKMKDKRKALSMAARQARYKKEDAIRHKAKLRADKLQEAQVKKFKNSGNIVLCTENIIDVIKLGVTTVTTFLRCIFRAVLDPKVTWTKVQEVRDDPSRITKVMGAAWSDSGISSTVKRVGMRCRHMPVTTGIVDRLESHAATSFLLHACDKNAKSRLRAMNKLKKKKRVHRREPTDFQCSLYMASLRKKPNLWVYYRCPWFYPHFVGMKHTLRQFLDVCLFLLAVVVWSPCLLCMEVCRTTMCCTACTG